MKIIKQIVEDMKEELDSAEHYAKKYAELKDSNRECAEKYQKMAQDELRHVDMLHEMAVKEIKAEMAKGVVTPPAMQAVWDWEHEKMIDKTARIKVLLNMER